MTAILVPSSEFNLGHVLWPSFGHWDAEGSSWMLLGMVSLLLKERHIRRDVLFFHWIFLYMNVITGIVAASLQPWVSYSEKSWVERWENIGSSMTYLNFQSWSQQLKCMKYTSSFCESHKKFALSRVTVCPDNSSGLNTTPKGVGISSMAGIESTEVDSYKPFR